MKSSFKILIYSVIFQLNHKLSYNFLFPLFWREIRLDQPFMIRGT